MFDPSKLNETVQKHLSKLMIAAEAAYPTVESENVQRFVLLVQDELSKLISGAYCEITDNGRTDETPAMYAPFDAEKRERIYQTALEIKAKNPELSLIGIINDLVEGTKHFLSLSTTERGLYETPPASQ
jgi:hypothetical protein